MVTLEEQKCFKTSTYAKNMNMIERAKLRGTGFGNKIITLHLMFLNWECYGEKEIQGREEKSVEIWTCHGRLWEPGEIGVCAKE